MLRYIRTYFFSSALRCRFSGGGWRELFFYVLAMPLFWDCWGELLTKRRDNVLRCPWTLTQPFRRSLIAWPGTWRRWHIFAITLYI